MVRGKRSCFAGNAFHHVAIATEDVHVVIEHLKSGFVKVCAEPPAGHGHAHARRHTLAERSGCGLHARSPTIFRMAGALAIELPEVLEILQRHAQLAESFVFGIDSFHLGQMEQCIKQH